MYEQVVLPTQFMLTLADDPIEVVRKHSLTTPERDEIQRHIVDALEQAGLVGTEKHRVCGRLSEPAKFRGQQGYQAACGKAPWRFADPPTST